MGLSGRGDRSDWLGATRSLTLRPAQALLQRRAGDVNTFHRNKHKCPRHSSGGLGEMVRTGERGERGRDHRVRRRRCRLSLSFCQILRGRGDGGRMTPTGCYPEESASGVSLPGGFRRRTTTALYSRGDEERWLTSIQAWGLGNSTVTADGAFRGTVCFSLFTFAHISPLSIPLFLCLDGNYKMLNLAFRRREGCWFHVMFCCRTWRCKRKVRLCTVSQTVWDAILTRYFFSSSLSVRVRSALLRMPLSGGYRTLADATSRSVRGRDVGATGKWRRRGTNNALAKWGFDARVWLEILHQMNRALSWRMSATPHAEAEGVVSKVQVKKEIKTIVENLETILGDLKDVAKELKEVQGAGNDTHTYADSHTHTHTLCVWAPCVMLFTQAWYVLF